MTAREQIYGGGALSKLSLATSGHLACGDFLSSSSASSSRMSNMPHSQSSHSPKNSSTILECSKAALASGHSALSDKSGICKCGFVASPLHLHSDFRLRTAVARPQSSLESPDFSSQILECQDSEVAESRATTANKVAPTSKLPKNLQSLAAKQSFFRKQGKAAVSLVNTRIVCGEILDSKANSESIALDSKSISESPSLDSQIVLDSTPSVIASEAKLSIKSTQMDCHVDKSARNDDKIDSKIVSKNMDCHDFANAKSRNDDKIEYSQALDLESKGLTESAMVLDSEKLESTQAQETKQSLETHQTPETQKTKGLDFKEADLETKQSLESTKVKAIESKSPNSHPQSSQDITHKPSSQNSNNRKPSINKPNKQNSNNHKLGTNKSNSQNPSSIKSDSPKEPPTIVTAYYKLNLASQSKKSYKAKRTTQTYLDYFSFWARVPNTFIIYTSEDIESEIYAMRERHGLRDKTIVIHKPLESFDERALDSIRKVFGDYDQASDRFDPEHPPHTSPEYNYLMYCKSFFVCDAIANPLTQGHNLEQILWLDFGYNLGGNTYTKSEEFDFPFVPQDEFSAELAAHNATHKLCFFGLGKPDNRHLPHILISGTEHFLTGCCMYGSKQSWLKFNAHMQEALRAFISFGIMDDDQKLCIWCVCNYPQDFHTLPLDDWFNALYYFMPESKRKNISTTRPSLLQESLDSEYIATQLANAAKNQDMQNAEQNKQGTQKQESFFKRIAKRIKRSVRAAIRELHT